MNAIDRLIELDCMTAKRIAVIGDSLTDIYIHGRLESCQDDCQKFVEESRVECDGGARNAARSLENWNAETIMFFDLRGDSIVKTRFVANGKCALRHDNDTISFDLSLARRETMKSLDSWKPNAVLISDYDKGFLTPEFIRQIIEYSQRRGIPCVADAKREPELYREAIIKFNDDYERRFFLQCERLTNMVKTNGDSHPVVQFSERREVSRQIATVVTRKPLWSVSKLPKVKCVSHVGAGDCFAAHLTLALAHGMSLEDSAAIAHSAGRVYVQHPHNRPPYPHEIRADFLNLGEPILPCKK